IGVHSYTFVYTCPVQRVQQTQLLLLDSCKTFNVSAPEMSTCVRTRDCEEGLCCTRYLNSKRCLRIPVEGEACLLRGATKRKSNLGRCSCDRGLSCTAASQTESGKNKGQGVCRPSPQQAQRKTRHSGKKRRTAERSC
uniref:Dickkopf-related protein 1/2/4 C-terminal subdomain 1 domain-containing protein n=1 Tax=Anabas testudineus TaxID=64144 RepID=A0A3Q1IIA2_ANATE